uniref:Uncharacterized protein AlNc14C126G6832 n=1 Tax=Albugo laibachii Nc14 TaxID=890382 RepID=F0WJW6_9STRA|nr:conserved hypothetical protein [Albugo laibachii Nc14]|eukprot:CCA21568.1 conserved hypothetical protein [Albugo laibachii Nc14]
MIKALGREIGQHGFETSSRGLGDFFNLLGAISSPVDHGIVQDLIALRKTLTPTGKWIVNDQEAKALREQIIDEEALHHSVKTLRITVIDEPKEDAHVESDEASIHDIEPIILSSLPRKLAVLRGDRVMLEVRVKQTTCCQWFCDGKVVWEDLYAKGSWQRPNVLIIPSFKKRLIGDYICRCCNGNSYRETAICHLALAKFHAKQIAIFKLVAQPLCDPILLSVYPSHDANYGATKAIAFCLRGSLCLFEQDTFRELRWVTADGHSSINTFENLRCISRDETSSLMVLAKSSEILLTSFALLRPSSGHSEEPVSKKDQSIASVCLKVLGHVSLNHSYSARLVQFIARGTFILVLDMHHTVLIYSVADILDNKRSSCFHQLQFSRKDTELRDLNGSAHAPFFAVCYKGSRRVEVFEIRERNRKLKISPNRYSLVLNRQIQLKLDAFCVVLDDHGFHVAVEEYSCLKSWLSVHSIRNQSIEGISSTCGNKRRVFAHDGRISTIKWTTEWSGWIDLLVSAGCSDGYVRLWDFERNICLYQFCVHERGISRLDIRPDGILCCLLYERNQLALYRLKAWKRFHKTRLHQKYGTSVNTIRKVWKGFYVRSRITSQKELYKLDRMGVHT